MDLMLDLNENAKVPLYQQVADQIRAAILAGRLGKGTRLPSSRELAMTHGIARNTTVLAYQQLVSEEYLERRDRSGHYVNPLLPDDTLQSVRATAEPTAGQTLPISGWARKLLTGGAEPYESLESLPFDFRPRIPGADIFPMDRWRLSLNQVLDRPASQVLCYDHPAGYLPLRNAIAAYLGRTRGVVCAPEQVIITTGAHQAVDLVLRTLLDPTDTVAIEDPGFPAARYALTAAGARLVPIPVDEGGLQVEALEQTEGIKLIYVTPSNQYPTGVTLELPRRLALLEWARRTGAFILEDDYDGDFRYEGRPLQSLQGLDGGHSVIYVGTFSKSLSPALRLGYLVAPKPLVKPLTAAKWLIDRQTATIPQAALTLLITEGVLERHLRKTRKIFRHRRDVFLNALDRHIAGSCHGAAHAGMHVLVTLPGIADPETAKALTERARREGIGLQPARACYSDDRWKAGFMFWYAHMDEAHLEMGVRRLAAVLRQ